MGLVSTLHRFKTDWRLLTPLLLLNLAGMGFGWYYYHDVGQFDFADLDCSAAADRDPCQPWWLWILVADSPNAVALFFVAALAYRLTGWRNKWFDAFAFTLNIYVGCWTTFLFLSFSDRMGTFDYASVATGNANPVLFIAHMGMPLQSFVLLHDMRRDRWGSVAIFTILASLVAYIAVDYWGVVGQRLPRGVLHPAPFLHPDDRILHVGSPLLMVAAALAWLTVVLWPRGLATKPPMAPRTPMR